MRALFKPRLNWVDGWTLGLGAALIVSGHEVVAIVLALVAITASAVIEKRLGF